MRRNRGNPVHRERPTGADEAGQLAYKEELKW